MNKPGVVELHERMEPRLVGRIPRTGYVGAASLDVTLLDALHPGDLIEFSYSSSAHDARRAPTVEVAAVNEGEGTDWAIRTHGDTPWPCVVPAICAGDYVWLVGHARRVDVLGEIERLWDAVKHLQGASNVHGA